MRQSGKEPPGNGDALEKSAGSFRMLDKLIPGMEPYSEAWEAAVSLRERNRYYYEILAFGTVQERRNEGF